MVPVTPTLQLGSADSAAARVRSRISLASLTLGILAVATAFLLISPPSGSGYPGAIAWSDASLLKPLVDLLSLGGSVQTARGVEIKDLAFHLAATLALLLFGLRALASGLLPPQSQTARGAWFLGQIFLAGWVALSFVSSLWSTDAHAAIGQSALYALGLAWAVSLAWTLEGRDVPRLIWGYAIAAACGAALCVWYYHERNPFHRPGFPIGNPSSLAACVLPALLIVLFVLAGEFATRPLRPDWRRTVGAALLLAPLGWCFLLTNSRGAMLGALAGVGGLVFLLIKRRVRWLIVIGGLALAAAAIWWAAGHNQEMAMARGATLRFRLYTWQYAAIMWSYRPVSGNGAGSYPRLSGQVSIDDRKLDPAAFMGDAVEHAHNELFEVFAEIGLIGGVTFVAGLLATLVAASGLLQASHSPQRRWLLYGLVAGLIALLADALFGVTLRLPGGPAVFYTLLGAVWAAARSVSKRRAPEAPVEAAKPQTAAVRYGVGGCAFVGAILAAVVALGNWNGVQLEQQAEREAAKGEFGRAATAAREARDKLLDPVRQLVATDYAVRAGFDDALAAVRDFASLAQSAGPQTQPAAGNVGLEVRRIEAAQKLQKAYEQARAFDAHARAFGRPLVVAAQAAEVLSNLSRAADPAQAKEWSERAFQAWIAQRLQRPYDAATLMALTRYPLRTADLIGLLRDALRAGFPPDGWSAALQQAAAADDGPETINDFLAAIQPINPATDVDALVLSGAPEMHRLVAALLAATGRQAEAADEAAKAAALYVPLRSRFPTLHSVALAEQADYALRTDPFDPENSIQLVREAIAKLPVIQEQKYEEQLRPYRSRLAHYWLAAGNEEQARAAGLELAPTEVVAWKAWGLARQGRMSELDELLSNASRAGVTDEALAQIRRSLATEFPNLAP